MKGLTCHSGTQTTRDRSVLLFALSVRMEQKEGKGEVKNNNNKKAEVKEIA